MPDLHVILAVEDDEKDALLMRAAFKRAALGLQFHCVKSAPEAVLYLEGTDRYSDRSAHPLPTLIVVDIKLPGMNGFELLAWLRADPRFKSLPVVLNSSSSDPRDVEKSAELGASKFFPKTPNYLSLVNLLKEYSKSQQPTTLWTLAPIQQRDIWKAAVMRDYLGQ